MSSLGAIFRSVRTGAPPRRRWIVVGTVTAAVIVFWLAAPISDVYDGDLALIAAMGAIALNLLTGYAGQVSIGNAAFLAIGAYMVVFLPGVPFPIPVLVGAVAAGIVGFVIGLPSLRLRGLYLIFSTLALQFVVSFAFNQYDSSSGAIGGHFIPAPSLAGWHLSDNRSWFIVLIVVLAAIAAFARNLVRGRPGRAWSALRANEAAAAVVGVDVTRAKLTAFTASAAIVGLSGALGAYFLQDVGYDYYSLTLAVSYIAMILIGGLASIWGSIIGAIVVTMIPIVSSNLASSLTAGGGSSFIQRNISAIDLAIYGLAVLVFLYFRPAGMASLAKLGRRRSAGRPSARADSSGLTQMVDVSANGAAPQIGVQPRLPAN